MKIWLVQTGEEMPFDGPNTRLLRTALLANELAARGHDVTYLNASFNHQQKRQRSAMTSVVAANPLAGHNYTSYLLKGRAYTRNISVGRFLCQRENARAFKKIAPSLPTPDIVYCGFPPIELAHASVTYAKKQNIPVVADCRDMWPEVIAERLPSILRLLAKPVIGLMELQKRATLRNATAITGITKHFVAWGLKAAGRQARPEDRPFHLAASPNTSAPEDLDAARAFWTNMIGPADAEVRVGCFVGTLAQRLDIETMLDGLDLLSDDERSRIRIALCGKGDLQDEVERRASRNVALIFGGWRNGAELTALMERSDFGILPYPNTADFLASYPNKVGEYLIAGLPILTGLDGATGSLLDEAGVRLPYVAGDAESFANALRTILMRGESPGLAQQAKALGASQFDARRIYPAFADWLEDIASKGAIAA